MLLSATPFSVPTGRGPCCLQYSNDSEHLFVGCHDGSVETVCVGGPKLEQSWTLSPDKAAVGISCMVHLRDGRLAVGTRTGGVFTIAGWEDPESRGSWSPLTEGSGGTPVLFLREFKSGKLLVGLANSNCYITGLQPHPKPQPTAIPFVGLTCAVRRPSPASTASPWLLISASGRMALVGIESRKPSPSPVRTHVPIGYVSDFALVKTPWEVQQRKKFCWQDEQIAGVYLATDNGLVLVSTIEPEKKQYHITLPGLTVPIVAASFFADGGSNQCFLWVSDSSGQSYLFQAFLDRHNSLLGKAAPSAAEPTTEELTKNLWMPLATQQENVRVTRAFISWRPPANAGGPAFLVGRVNDGETVAVGLYRPIDDQLQILQSTEFRESAVPRKFWLLLVSGTVETLKKISKEESKRHNPAHSDWRWTAATLVADLFEWAGERSPDDLYDFLLHPTASLAKEALGEEIRNFKKESRADQGLIYAPKWHDTLAKRAAAILMLWTNSLLGALHHASPGEQKEKAYFGILRWLRQVEEAVSNEDWVNKSQEFTSGVDQCIRRVRKWGTERNALGRHAHSLIEMQKIAERASAHEPGGAADSSVYTAHLLQRRYDTIAVSQRTRRPGVTAWDIKVDDHYDEAESGEHERWRRSVVVSWSRGVEFYELTLDPTTKDPCGPHCAVLVRHLTENGRVSDAAGDDGEQYCRAVAITRSRVENNRPLFILAHRKSDPNLARFEIWKLSEQQKLIHVHRKLLTGQESVYSMLELEQGLVLVGLRGRGGRPRLGVLRGDENDIFHYAELPLDFDPVSPRGEETDRNPVWALAVDRAKAKGKTADGCHHVAAGCDDGSVWYLTIPVLAMLVKEWASLKSAAHDKPGPNLVFGQERIGVLGSSVWSVAVRRRARADMDIDAAHDETTQENDAFMRVTAGGQDGSITCWQRRPSSTLSEQSQTLWMSIWATREASAITRIHLYDRPPNDLGDITTRGARSPWTLLALTQGGRALVILDRSVTEAPPSLLTSKDGRAWVPGQRLDRIDLGTSILASDVLRTAPRRGPWPAVLIANEYGQVQVVQPYHLRDALATKQVRDDLFDSWKQLAGVNANSGSDEFFDLRAQEAMAGACSQLRLSSIRWLFTTEDKLPAWSWVPRRMRRAAMLASLWREAIDTKKTPPRPRAVGDVIGDLVSRMFRQCQELEDIELYRELLTQLLSKMNDDILVAMRPETDTDRRERILRVSLGIMAAMERTDYLWVGASVDVDVRIKITRTKALMDGYVLAALGSFIDAPPVTSPEAIRLAGELLVQRVKLVETLLGQGQVLLTLEVLRAVNLSLVRFLISKTPKEHDPVGPTLTKDWLPWARIQSYFFRLRSVAGRIAHSGTGLDDALSHEVARAFALACCCCPNRISLISHLLSEADLPQDVFRDVTLQFHAIKELTGFDTERFNKFYELVSDWRKEGKQQSLLDPAEVYKLLGFKEGGPSSPPSDALSNEGIVYEWEPWHRLIAQIWDVADALEQHPSVVDVRKLVESIQWLRSLKNRSETSRFYHTQGVWYHVLCEPSDHGDDLPKWIKHIQELDQNTKEGRGSDPELAAIAAPEGRTEPARLRANPDARRLTSASQAPLMGRFPDQAEASDQDPIHAPKERLHPNLLLEVRPKLMKWCVFALAHFREQRRKHLLFEPQGSAYMLVVERLWRAAENLPENSAVLGHIVVEVLNHGLLESLTDHVFDFVEVTQTLDPQYAEKLRQRILKPPGDRVEAVTSMMDQFVAHLDRYRKRAEDVPETLWSLKELLAIPGAGAKKVDLRQELYANGEYRGKYDWEQFITLLVSERKARILRLVFQELSANHHKHGVENSIAIIDSNKSSSLTMRFPLVRSISGQDGTEKIHEHYDRLENYMKSDISISMSPAVTSRGLSHGNGFYMMHVLLALINWKLDVWLCPDLESAEEKRMKISSDKNRVKYGCLVVTMTERAAG